MSYHNWNQTTIAALRKNVSRFIRTDDNGDNVYITIALATPTDAYGETRKERQESAYVVTDNAGTVHLNELDNADSLVFSVTLEQTGFSTFAHNGLKNANTIERSVKAQFGINVTFDESARVVSISSWQMFGKFNPPMTNESGNIAYLIHSHLSFAAKDKAKQQWVKRNGSFVDKR